LQLLKTNAVLQSTDLLHENFYLISWLQKLRGIHCVTYSYNNEQRVLKSETFRCASHDYTSSFKSCALRQEGDQSAGIKEHVFCSSALTQFSIYSRLEDKIVRIRNKLYVRWLCRLDTLADTITGPNGANLSKLSLLTRSKTAYDFENPHCGTPPASLESRCHFLRFR